MGWGGCRQFWVAIHAEENPPGGAFLLQQVEVEERGGQAHGQVHGRHLVLFHQADHVVQEAQQRLQDVTALVRQQQGGRLRCLQPLLLGDIWGRVGARPSQGPAGRQRAFPPSSAQTGRHAQGHPTTWVTPLTYSL